MQIIFLLVYHLLLILFILFFSVSNFSVFNNKSAHISFLVSEFFVLLKKSFPLRVDLKGV